MTMLSELKTLAQLATPGPWEVHENPRYWVCFPDQEPAPEHEPSDPNRDANAAYVAACEPDRMLQMIAVIEAADAMRREQERQETGLACNTTVMLFKYDAARAALEKP